MAARLRVLILAVVFTSASSAASCRCNQKRPPQVHALGAGEESALLPRVTYAPVPADALTTRLESIRVGDATRRYVVVAPASPEPNKSYPLVLVFHGDGGDAAGFHRGYPFENASGKDAFLAYPEGLRATWDLETKTDNRDVLFVEAVINEIASRSPIDRTRIFATGYSSGGFLSNVLACHRPGLFRAIASNAGGAPYNQAEKWGNGYPKCPGQKPIAMLALHGEQDFGVDLDSGRFSAEYWAYVNGCTTTEMETSGYVECHMYRGCPKGKAVGFCSVPSLGHWVWNTAAEATWTFFQRAEP